MVCLEVGKEHETLRSTSHSETRNPMVNLLGAQAGKRMGLGVLHTVHRLSLLTALCLCRLSIMNGDNRANTQLLVSISCESRLSTFMQPTIL